MYGPGSPCWEARDQIRSDQIDEEARLETVDLMLRACERGQQKTRSRSKKKRRGDGGGESGAIHRAGELEGLGSHDIHRKEAEGGDRCRRVHRRR